MVRPGAVPKLIVTGQVCTHPYAQAFLKEGASAGAEPETLCLTLCVLADTPRADLKTWTAVSFEANLLNRGYQDVTIAGAGLPTRIAIRQVVG